VTPGTETAARACVSLMLPPPIIPTNTVLVRTHPT
jgi:hypothetical protein